MAYEVLARKWRPQQFDDVVGQSHATHTLKNAIKTKRIAHAYLFVGPRGIGKTSIARIFAKALNCQKGPTPTPCDACDACREIAAGSSLDVLEIDGASNNGVDQVRELRETVKYMPSHGTFKVIIIDEVHMLSASAFNALLKTLEEPPPHVKFIFATTEPDKILPTILSRCQRFDLRRIPVASIADRLRVIARAEKVDVDEDALRAIARGAEGGLRDAESALDQLIAFRGSTIREEDVLSVFGLTSRATLEGMGESVLKGDVRALLRTVAALDEGGKNLQRATSELMEHFRNLLVAFHVEKPEEGMDLAAEQIERLRGQMGLTDPGRVLRVIDILAETNDRLRYALSKRTLLETALIRCARAASVASLEEILSQINALKAQTGGEAGPPEGGGAEPAAPASAFAPTGTSGPARAAEGTGAAVYRTEREPAEAAPAPAPAAAAPAGEELQGLKQKWAEVIDRAGRISVPVRSALVDATPVAIDGGRVVVDLDPEFGQEMSQFEVPRNRMAVERAIGAVLKRTVAVDFTCVGTGGVNRDAGPAPGVQPAPAAEEASPPARGSAEAQGGPGKANRRPLPQDWLRDPAVEKTLEVFGGTIVNVREYKEKAPAGPKKRGEKAE